MHKTTDRFWKCFDKLPRKIQELARENFELLKNDPNYPSLQLKRIGNLWSARVTLNYRVLAYEDGEDFIWLWIGTHEEYERMIKTMA
jgi:mRNA-degrading endonuclease RelE of RelBE toxin-antitoxin system